MRYIFKIMKYLYIKGFVFYINLLSSISYKKNTVIAGPGYMGFRGGVFNPGTILTDNGIFLLAKACHIHSLESSKKGFINFMAGMPLLFHFTKELSCTKVTVIEPIMDFHADYNIGIEDFRVFIFKNKLYVNHPVCHLLPSECYRESFMSISSLDIEKNKLVFMGKIELDFKSNPKEKNWVCFEHENCLYLLYSFQPYILLKAINNNILKFKTFLNQNITYPYHKTKFFDKKWLTSFSTNPISYDNENFLVIIHQRQLGSIYFQWAVLISKKSLLPVKISAKPIFIGGKNRGVLKGVIYTTSVVLLDDELIFFNGEGDSYISYTKIKKSRLDKLFIDI